MASQDSEPVTRLRFENRRSLLPLLPVLRSKRKAGKHLRKVVLRRKGVYVGMDPPVQVDRTQERWLFGELGTHPLVDFSVYFPGLVLSTESLAHLLQQTIGSLESLRLCRLSLQGGIEPLKEALRKHITLEKISLQLVTLEGGRDFELVKSFSSCPNLQHLALSDQPVGTEVVSAPDNNQAFQDWICLSPNLQVLHLSLCPGLNESMISGLFHSLESNTTVRILYIVSLSTLTEAGGAQAESDMLRVNNTLQDLLVSVLCTPLKPIVEAMKINGSLKILRLSSVENAEAEVVSRSCVDMLENNCTLEELGVRYLGLPWRNASIEFYLKLNQAGRRRLTQEDGVTQKDWLDAIISVSKDESAIFYLLSKNPSLCQLAISHKYSNESGERLRKRARLGSP